MTKFEMLGIGDVKLYLMSPILNLDLDLEPNQEWEGNSFPNATVLVSDYDVTVTVTGFWGEGSTLQLTASHTGASEVATVSFCPSAKGEEAAPLELNTAIENLLVNYLPTQGWRII
jgi:hypothetical protein